MRRAEAIEAVKNIPPEWRTIIHSAAHAKVIRHQLLRAAENPPEDRDEAEMVLYSILAAFQHGFEDLLTLSDSYDPETNTPCIAPAGAEEH